MGGACIIKECPAAGSADQKFHRLPRDPNLKKLWLQAANHNGKFRAKHPTLCSAHFRPEDFVLDHKPALMGCKPKRALKDGAIPTLLMPGIISADLNPPKFEKVLRLPERPHDCHQAFSIEEHEKILNDKVPKMVKSEDFVFEPVARKEKVKKKYKRRKVDDVVEEGELEKVMYYVYQKEPNGFPNKAKHEEPASINNGMEVNLHRKPPTHNRQVQVNNDGHYNKELKRALALKNSQNLRLKREIAQLKRRQRQLHLELDSMKKERTVVNRPKVKVRSDLYM